MRTTLWMLIALLTASVLPDVPPGYAFRLPDVPEIKAPSEPVVPTRRKKRRKRPRRDVRPFGGGCIGGVITATDEVGGQIFPRSIAPVTTDAFIFSHVRRPLARPVEAALRAIVLGEDPPMITLAPVELYSLALEPGWLTVAGLGTVGGETGIVRCNTFSPADCQVVVPIERPITMERAGDDLFAVIMLENGSDVTRFVDGSGAQTSILEAADAPAFFERNLALRADTAFIAGYLGLEERSVVLAVPLDGGPIREEVTFDPGVHPGKMAFLGPDLLIEVDATVSNANPDASQPSRLIRVQFDASGEAQASTEIAIDASGFVNITDMEVLDGQIFLVDSQLRTASEGTSLATGLQQSGRLLRVCP